MWVLDSIAEIGKMSAVQVAILIEYAKSGEAPRTITEIIQSLKEYFKGFWEPKKGTIYPSVHNLDVRGFLKMHAIKPYGYSITEKGMHAIRSILLNLKKQFEVELRFFQFIIENQSEIDKNKANKLIDDITNFIKEFEEKITK
ncbi:MAG TPA: PadR family transcriptional regulator [candidate division Zixibacteria bacterium]|nr:PadR family transcriptional regulator [candidate division Zixibacteria bacterium]